MARTGLETLRSAARADPVNEPVAHEVLRRPDGTLIHCAGGSSMCVAGKALVVAELTRTTTGQEPLADGVLVTVPSRYLLAFHPITDGRAVNAVNDLTAYGLGAHQDSPGALSPRIPAGAGNGHRRRARTSGPALGRAVFRPGA
ncbi:hypothetical protein [Streptomyces sp. MST-110588]|uniref:hypothetical protein n=1 Tax=Streptomyces sp. MST-110588 TaxID=2833628 RepID=UPI001F5C4FDB|nr:hypothetical protein [Streptomyces sp. MST-110588]UNO43309.1 hypothetical protein KGS77_32270 [Streptomyces sp. MST-110588]